MAMAKAIAVLLAMFAVSGGEKLKTNIERRIFGVNGVSGGDILTIPAWVTQYLWQK